MYFVYCICSYCSVSVEVSVLLELVKRKISAPGKECPSLAAAFQIHTNSIPLWGADRRMQIVRGMMMENIFFTSVSLTQRKISLRKFRDFNPFLAVNCKTWESKFVRCHVPSDHCVWSDLFQRALKSLTGRWWRGGTRHFHWCWDLPLESHPIISFQWISPDFGIYPGLQTRFPWIRRLCFQILSSLILRHCSALLQRNALECLVEMYPQCKEQSLLRKSSSQ